MIDQQIRELVRRLNHKSPAHSAAARMLLVALQEKAVGPLIDELYAGVSDAQGIVILDMLAEIGGPEAMEVLRSIFTHETQRPALQTAAARGLRHNVHNLSLSEVEAVSLFLVELDT